MRLFWSGFFAFAFVIKFRFKDSDLFLVFPVFIFQGIQRILNALEFHLRRDQFVFDLIQFFIFLSDLVTKLIRLFLQFNTFCSSPDK